MNEVANYRNLTDRLLLERWQANRDADAFEEIVARHLTMVFNTGRRVLRDESAAEDVTQECFFRLLTKRPHIRTSLGGWLHRVAVTCSLDHLRSRKRRTQREESLPAFNAEVPRPEIEELLTCLDQAVAKLPERYREPVVLRFLESRKHGEIAELLGISEAAARARVHRGLEKLRKGLRAKGIDRDCTDGVAVLGPWLTMMPSGSLKTTIGKRLLLDSFKTEAVAAAAGRTLIWWTVRAVLPSLVVTAAFLGLFMAPWRDNTTVDVAADTVAVGETLASDESPTEQDEVTARQGMQEEPSVSAAPFYGSAAVFGRAYDGRTGVGVAGVTVFLYEEQAGMDWVASATTDADGRFEMGNLTAKRYLLKYDTPGAYLKQNFSLVPSGIWVVPGEEGEGEGVAIVLAPGATVAGAVVDVAGAPVSDATVVVRGSDYRRPFMETTTSREDGRFDIAGLPQVRQMTVQAKKAPLASEQPTVDPGEDGTARVTLVLNPACVLSGMVVDTNEAPQPDFGIFLMRGDESVVSSEDMLETDAQGRFNLSVCAGEYSLKGRRGLLTVRETGKPAEIALIPGQAVEELVLVYDPGQCISGHVYDADGKPKQRAVVFADGISATTDEQGAYTLTGLADGYYRVTAGFGYKAPTAVAAAGSTDVDFVMPARNLISGHVVDARTGAPMREFDFAWMTQTEVNASCPPSRSFITFHTDTGEFHAIQDSAPVTVVAARAPGFATAIRWFRLEPGQEVDDVVLALEPGGTLSGVIVDSMSKPIAGAAVTYGSFEDVRPVAMRPEAEAVSDAGGRFEIPWFPTEPVRITVTHPNFMARTVEVANEGQPVRLVLCAAESRCGTIYIEEGALASVFLLDAAYGVAAHVLGNAELGENGQFCFKSVSPNAVQMMIAIQYAADKLRHISRPFHAEPEQEDDLNIVIPPATASIEGSVPRDLETTADIRVWVAIDTPYGVDMRGEPIDGSGHFFVDHIAAGAGTLNVEGIVANGEATSVSVPIQIASGEHLVRNVDIDHVNPAAAE